MVHIKAYFPTIRPSNNKKDSKINLLFADGGSFTKTTTRGISAFNFGVSDSQSDLVALF